MACGCGKRNIGVTSAQAAAAYLASQPKYQVTRPDGSQETFDLYVDAKTEARQAGGTLTEVR
jgi:hypothetical protein